MRKEVLFAIFLGIALGGAVAFGIWRANLAFGPKKEDVATSQTPVPQDNISSSQLVVTQPEDNSISAKDKITIKGATTPASTIVITTEADSQITQTNSEGGFEQEVTLAPGPNQVLIKAFDAQGNESEQRLTVVYSTEFEQQ